MRDEPSAPTAPALPVGFEDVLALAENLRWTWHIEVRRFFARLFPDASPGDLEWPLRLVAAAGRATIEARLSADRSLLDLAVDVVADRVEYLAEAPVTWYPTTHPGASRLQVAYLSAEFALTDSIPVFAGGLGAIAGEQLKSSSALGVPLIGVGLLYRETSHQWLDETGVQQERWEVLDPDQLPLSLARDPAGVPVQVSVPFPGRAVVASVWTAPVGRTRLYLLDTNVEDNTPGDRAITARLYGGDLETRIQQELVLGVGGLRAVHALGYDPTVLHLNEGHTAFSILEHVATLAARHGVGFGVARRLAAAGIVFTTHTPVNAGHDYFPAALAGPYLAPYADALGLDLEVLLSLGRYRPEDPDDTFCPTVFAFRMSDHHNGVSRLHGAVTRQQWGGLWPKVPVDEVPIGHVTNGVHLQSWITPEIDRLLDRQLGKEWRSTPGGPETWANMLRADDVELWAASCAARRRLVDATRSRRRSLLRARGDLGDGFDDGDWLLDPDALTIGFVGRFVAYKRPTLFLRDEQRLARLLTDPDRPVQIVFAGKAHPNDEHGKGLMRTVIDFAHSRGLRHRIVFLEDFDLTADRALAQGVDLWLNTPRRPLEACGIGGMKSGVNGALNLSTLDGWWDEVWNDADPLAPPIGWSIGTATDFEDHEAQDALDAASLYDCLEHEIIPCFFDRDDDGIPKRWLASVRQAMATLSETWRSHRMVQQYVEERYLPSATRAGELAADHAHRARSLSASIARLRDAWPAVGVRVATVGDPIDGMVRVGLDVALGGLAPADLDVQLWVTPSFGPPFAVTARRARMQGDDLARCCAELPASTLAGARIAARVLPDIVDAPSRFIPGLIAWSNDGD